MLMFGVWVRPKQHDYPGISLCPKNSYQSGNSGYMTSSYHKSFYSQEIYFYWQWSLPQQTPWPQTHFEGHLWSGCSPSSDSQRRHYLHRDGDSQGQSSSIKRTHHTKSWTPCCLLDGQAQLFSSDSSHHKHHSLDWFSYRLVLDEENALITHGLCGQSCHGHPRHSSKCQMEAYLDHSEPSWLA